MKKRHVRKYVQQAEDRLEVIQRKMRNMEGALFFITLGMESFYQSEDCCEAGTVQAIRNYLKSLTSGEMKELEKALKHLKKD